MKCQTVRHRTWDKGLGMQFRCLSTLCGGDLAPHCVCVCHQIIGKWWKMAKEHFAKRFFQSKGTWKQPCMEFRWIQNICESNDWLCEWPLRKTHKCIQVSPPARPNTFVSDFPSHSIMMAPRAPMCPGNCTVRSTCHWNEPVRGCVPTWIAVRGELVGPFCSLWLFQSLPAPDSHISHP
jgi:hypothetical protein